MALTIIRGESWLANVARAAPLNPMRPDSLVQSPLPLERLDAGPGVRRTMGLPPGEYLARYRLGECSVIVTREFGRWHLSIAHPDRYPTWDEISQARYRILPADIWVAQYLPPPSEYVNLHRNCFQLMECEEPPC